MSDSENKDFDAWCIVELFGHNRIAGRVTNAEVGGSSFLRVDVPTTPKREGFTRMFGNGAIYALNPVTEAIATVAAEKIDADPVKVWDLSDEHIRQAARRMMRDDPDFAGSLLPAPAETDEEAEWLGEDDDNF